MGVTQHHEAVSSDPHSDPVSLQAIYPSVGICGLNHWFHSLFLCYKNRRFNFLQTGTSPQQRVSRAWWKGTGPWQSRVAVAPAGPPASHVVTTKAPNLSPLVPLRLTNAADSVGLGFPADQMKPISTHPKGCQERNKSANTE